MRVLFITFFMLMASWSYAVEPEMNHDSSQPVKITSEQLEADDQSGTFIFKGDVQAQQGEVFIYAKKMTVSYVQGEKRQIETVVAEGDVRIVQLNRVATGGKATLYHKEGRIVLSDEPRVVQGENTVEGERIIVYLNDNRSIVEGSSERRVKAVFTPGEETK